MKTTRSGVANPKLIDVVTRDPKTDTYKLVLVEDRPWGADEDQLQQLQDKLNRYLSYALDGHLHKQYPSSIGRPIQIQLDCFHTPDRETEALLQEIEAAILSYGIRFSVRVIQP